MVRCGSSDHAAVFVGAALGCGGRVGLRHGQVDESLAGPQRQGRCRRGRVVAGVWASAAVGGGPVRPGRVRRTPGDHHRRRHRTCQKKLPKRPCAFRHDDDLAMDRGDCLAAPPVQRERTGPMPWTGGVCGMFMVRDASAKGAEGRVVGGGFHGFPVLVGGYVGFGPRAAGPRSGTKAVLVGEDDRSDSVPGVEFGEHRRDVGPRRWFRCRRGRRRSSWPISPTRPLRRAVGSGVPWHPDAGSDRVQVAAAAAPS